MAMQAQSSANRRKFCLNFNLCVLQSEPPSWRAPEMASPFAEEPMAAASARCSPADQREAAQNVDRLG